MADYFFIIEDYLWQFILKREQTSWYMTHQVKIERITMIQSTVSTVPRF